MKVNQKTAVYQAILMVLSAQGIPFKDGDNVHEHMTKENRAKVNGILIDGFNAGDIELDRTYDTEAELKTYVSSLQSNWIRKDIRLNGGTKYAAKAPGSRAGSGDAQLKNMKLLLQTLTPGTDDYCEVEEAIHYRTTEVAATKVKAVAVDFSALPESLRKFAKA